MGFRMSYTGLALTFALTLLAACDGPSRVRTPSGNFENAVGTSGATTTGSSGGTTSVDGSTGAKSNEQLPAGYESCNTTPNYYHAGIGYVSVCQNSGNELQFRMGFSTTDQTDGTCIVPMYKDSAGNSAYVGNAQCTKHNANQVVYGTLTKNRSGYTQYPVNGVMVIKYSGTNSFFQCMNAYGTSYESCRAAACAPYSGNGAYYQSCMAASNAACDASARNYMTSVCNTFKGSSPYIDIRTK